MKRIVMTGIPVLALGMALLGTGCAADAGPDGADQTTPTESLLDPKQSGPVDAPAE